MKIAVAYLRKSKVTSDRHVSWEVQESEVRALAAKRGDAELVVLSDWSRSGRGSKTRLRAEYLRMKAMIAAGEVSALYSYSLSRLARSTKELLDLAEVCAANKVPVRLAKEGDLDFGSSHGRLYLTVLAAVSTFEAEVAGERMADAVRARRARGDVLGLAPYGSKIASGRLVADPDESVASVIAAFNVAGSCFGAARALNEAGSRTRRGALWTSKVIGDVLRREGVAYRRRPRPGAKAAADWTLYQLVTCPCGNTMTAMDKRSPRLTCYKARHTPGHTRPYGVADTKLLPALMAEAAHLDAPSAIEAAAEGSAKREALSARRSRIIDTYTDGVIDKAERDRRLAEVDDAAEMLDAETRIVDVPTEIDWSWPPRQLNAVLRALWERVELGPDLTPMRFVWRVPSWRRA